MKFLRRLTLSVAAIVALNSTQMALAEAPSGYYSKCEGKTGQALLTALYETISSHTTVSYDGLWNVFKTSDVYPEDGRVWDMYSTKHWVVGAEHCGNYSVVGDCINREHSFPKSWFNDASPMYSDAFHLYPTDGKVNGQRSNYPYGECANGTTLASSGGVNALGKLGKSTFSGYSGTVFEPVDEYKGDFARSYFYMAACYNNKIGGWNSDMLAKNSYPCFSDWALNLLLKWHRQDAVSSKETVRNDAVYAHQKNRNPFIDHPELVEYIWGTKKGTAWYESGSSQDCFLTQPSDGSTINLGITAIGAPKQYTLKVAGTGISEEVFVQLTGSKDFTASPGELLPDAINAGTAKVVITYNPSAAGTSTASLLLGSGEVNTTVTITASAVDGIPAKDASEVTENSFIANWTNISDAGTKYSLYVKVNGELLPGYPVQVNAEDEKYLVSGLTPSTDYSYYLTCGSITSDVINVTTAAPAPCIQFLYDAELSFTAPAGEPSEVAEMLVSIENISSDVTISVTAPFEVSTDKTNWDTSVVLAPEEDRFYLRLFGNARGEYSTELIGSAGDYTSDGVTIYGTVTRGAGEFIEDFENVIQCYTTGEYEGTAAVWYFNNVGVDNETDYNNGYVYAGKHSARFGKNSNSSITMNEDKAGGIGVISFYSRAYGSDAAAEVNVDYSFDGGNTWTTAGAAAISGSEYKMYSYTVDKAGNCRVRLQQTSGKRIMVDDLSITNFNSGVEEIVDYHTWDAYSLAGELVIENNRSGNTVKVYGIDGKIVYEAPLAIGNTTVKLPKALYIVVVDDFARRVLVK